MAGRTQEAPAPGAVPSSPWHALGADHVVQALDSSAQEGLTEAEVGLRRTRVGPNVLPRYRGPGPLTIFWRQINEPLIYVLLASGALALAMGKTVDGAVVLGVVVVNAFIGFVQEYRAGRAIQALMNVVPEGATVLREGRFREVPAADLVPGDVVRMEAGDKAPADIRLLEARALRVDESMLTGESVPVPKSTGPLPEKTVLADRRNLVYGGALIVSGTAQGVVVATGESTELGRISSLLHEADVLETPLVRQLAAVGSWLAVVIVAVAVALLAVSLLRGFGISDALLVAVTLAVAAIPEGLPAIVTIALAIAVQRMARRNALIRSLPAAETLGGTTVICSDKTGTLTRNEMTVQAIRTAHRAYRVEGVGYAAEGRIAAESSGGGEDPELDLLLRAMVLASDAEIADEDEGPVVTGDPTEAALLVAARKAGLDVDEIRAAWPRAAVLPFESERRFMATLNRAGTGEGGEEILFVKGAPETVLDRCTDLGGADRDEILGWVEEMGREGMRVLAAAAAAPSGREPALEEDAAQGLRFLGLVGMIDPPRPEAIHAIGLCLRAGIAVKMITGDHQVTAAAVGRALGLVEGDETGISGAELGEMDEGQIEEVASGERVFARVAPEHKLALVRALQKRREVVAMTGDGVNDSPALRQADIGVAMGITGTAASREAADIVLSDDNFATIAAAVEEGRRIYDNLLKSFAFVLPTNLGLALILLCAVTAFPIVAGQPLLPMTPTQTLWINLVAAVALALPLAFEAMEPDVMQRPPRSSSEPLLGGFVVARSVVVAVLMTAGAVGLFTWEYYGEVGRGVASEVALREAQTMVVTTVVLFQIFYLFNCRSLRDSVLKIGFFSNPVVFLGIATVLVLQAAFVYLPAMNRLFGTAPLNADALSKAAAVALIVFPVISAEKWWRRRRDGSRP